MLRPVLRTQTTERTANDSDTARTVAVGCVVCCSVVVVVVNELLVVKVGGVGEGSARSFLSISSLIVITPTLRGVTDKLHAPIISFANFFEQSPMGWPPDGNHTGRDIERSRFPLVICGLVFTHRYVTRRQPTAGS